MGRKISSLEEQLEAYHELTLSYVDKIKDLIHKSQKNNQGDMLPNVFFKFNTFRKGRKPMPREFCH
ncbi:hypothetical protein [Bacillus coahuilensis]|uniref:hypothetical protein n=1 Tax=Bacillus coahuilensis TaxID=408580 RepID=UPI00018506E1|nr:hypothetical protein [Bacillus coahuilensis]